jgi:hypothetical protein
MSALKVPYCKKCQRHGAARPADGFNDDNEPLCEDCLFDWECGEDEE